jgi:epoxyqueuosine reductase
VSTAASAKKVIREYAWDLGIDGIGTCDAEPLTDTREVFESAIRQGLIPKESAPRPDTVIRLTTPEKHLRAARSVISAFEYYNNTESPQVDPRQGTISPYTRANHYLDLKLRLRMLAGFMEKEFACRTKVFSCYVALAEKPLARKAGIGFYGKHGVIITPAHGSLVVLAELITDLELEPDEPLGLSCGSCTRCMDACPTGAITAPYMLDRGRCIQHLSERRGVVPLPIRETWSNRIYGCSTCQDVCPRNERLSPTSRKVIFGHVGDSLPIQDILEMDDIAFHVRFRNNQIDMREPNAIRRNAVIAAGNSRLGSFLPALRKLARDSDPILRRHSLWAIAKIAGGKAKDMLEKASRGEQDPGVAGEIKCLLDGLGDFA